MASPAEVQTRVLDPAVAQKVSYAIPLWLRDEQIKLNIQRVRRRIQPAYDLRQAPIAVVCFGPSLNQTWEQVKDFGYIISCSGSHKFLIERGIVPTWHLEVDPRPHKVKLIGTPHVDVEYLIASTCHPDVFDHLKEFKTTLWHVFDTAEEGKRLLPEGEWAITGGCSVGLRAMTMARFLGFTDLHIFGMDGSEGPTGKHASEHPNQAKESFETVYDGVTYRTTPAFLEAARMTTHELDQMKDVKATFYGDGLVQHMARNYKPRKIKGDIIAFEKPMLISPEYRALNAQLHQDNLAYGVGAGRHAPTVLKLAASMKTQSILDYGCGKGYLAKEIPFPIWEYDPAIVGKQESPRPAELVCCLDVLEHIEPDKLKYVLKDLQRCTKQLGFFVINTGPARKNLPDGRNTHLIQENEAWWRTALSNCFIVQRIWAKGQTLYVLVSPLAKKKKPVSADAMSVVSQQALKLSFAEIVFRRDPYVIGCARGVLSQAHYDELTASFPTDLMLYRKFEGEDEKYSLSERNNPDTYQDFVQHSAPWKAFHDYIKAPAFAERVVAMLHAHRVPMSNEAAGLRARFEFSILPANGGLLRPHTDIPSKVVTLVLSMCGQHEAWELDWGGGTDVLAPKDPMKAYQDYAASLDVFARTHTFPYLPNQAVVFIKTDKSWHSVGPLTGPVGQIRKTVTINLERVE